MFYVHYIQSLENAKVLYGYDDHNKEFIITYKEITNEEFVLSKHMMDEARFFIEYSGKFYDILIRLETVFERNISTILNDNEKDTLINRIKDMTDFVLSELTYVGKDNYSFGSMVYGIQPPIWLIMSRMISGVI